MRKFAGIRGRAGVALSLAFVATWASTAAAQSDPAGLDPATPPASAKKSPTPSGDTAPPGKPGGLRMSRAVVCRTIDGYEKYTPLADAAQTSEEKLLVYYRPLRYKIEPVDGMYRAHLSQDNEIRRKGEKRILRQKPRAIVYEPKTKEPPRQLYLKSIISLKGLEPGDYELTIVLHDELDKSAPPTRQVVKFTIIPPSDPRAKKSARDAEQSSSGP